MFNLFKPKLPIDGAEFEWIMACTKWFSEQFGGMEQLRATILVRSNPEHFPKSRLQGHDRAIELFEQVKAHSGMLDWPCDLIIGERDPDPHVTTGVVLQRQSPAAPAGTFVNANGRVTVTYNPTLLGRPHDLVATFAHELAHFLMHSTSSLPPGGEELEEHATDLAAVMMGFGAFAANSAASFEQFQTAQEQGWQMSRMGYLSELSLVTAFALFVLLTGADQKEAKIELKPYLHSPFNKAITAIAHRCPDVASAVEMVDLEQWR